MSATTLIDRYEVGRFYDEMFSSPSELRPHYRRLHDYLTALTPEALADRRRIADAAFINQGITFTVYGQEDGIERIFPFDVVRGKVAKYKHWCAPVFAEEPVTV